MAVAVPHEHEPLRLVALGSERFQYFPRLVDRADPYTGDDEETWPLGYLERMAATEWNLTELLDAELRNDSRSTVVLTSHAASVALVSRLLGVELTVDLQFAPCGAYVLVLCGNQPVRRVHRQFVTKSFLGHDAAVLARSSER